MPTDPELPFDEPALLALVQGALPWAESLVKELHTFRRIIEANPADADTQRVVRERGPVLRTKLLCHVLRARHLGEQVAACPWSPTRELAARMLALIARLPGSLPF